MDAVRRMVDMHEKWGIKAVTAFPAGTSRRSPINDKRYYPIYAKCCELGIPIFCCAGVPGPRVPLAPQQVELIDEVCYDFPELTFVTRHGCEPWTDLAVKLMLKWPNLYYSTSAFAPKHYPKAIIDYANTRGADKIIYAGYFPMGLTYDRIMTDMPNVPFKDEVWPKFLRGQRVPRPQALTSARVRPGRSLARLSRLQRLKRARNGRSGLVGADDPHGEELRAAAVGVSERRAGAVDLVLAGLAAHLHAPPRRSGACPTRRSGWSTARRPTC